MTRQAIDLSRISDSYIAVEGSVCVEIAADVGELPCVYVRTLGLNGRVTVNKD